MLRYDPLTKLQRSERMRRIRSRDTHPELKVRQALFARGYRYRLHSKNLPGRPDIVFSGGKKIILVHGCFWHLHEPCNHWGGAGSFEIAEARNL